MTPDFLAPDKFLRLMGSGIMRNTKYLKSTAAAFGVMAIVSNAAAADGGWGGSYGNNAPDPFGARDRYANMSLDAKIQLLRQKVKYVFVIFHENRVVRPLLRHFPGRQRTVRGSSGLHARDPDAELQAAPARHVPELDDHVSVPDAPGRRNDEQDGGASLSRR